MIVRLVFLKLEVSCPFSAQRSLLRTLRLSLESLA